MSTRWYNLSDTDLLAWLQNFSGKLSATPLVFHITTEQAGTMAGLVSTFENKLSIWREPSSNSRTASLAKKAARIAVIEGAKNLVSAITTNPLTTDEQRGDLGIPLKTSPTPVPAPSASPDIDIVDVNGNTVTIRVHDAADPEHRRRPVGVKGAAIYSYVGPTPPGADGGWTFVGNSQKSTVYAVSFPNSIEPGSMVWVTAAWYNSRGEFGPAATPRSAYTQFGGANVQPNAMKVAA